MKIALVFIFFTSMLIQAFSQNLKDICSPAIADVYAAGFSGYLLRSSNGGSNFISSNSGTNDFNSIFAVSNNIWAIGMNGTYSKSSNKGVSWSNTALQGGADLYSVYFTDSLIGFISGAGGVVLRSTDGGNDWSLQPTGVTAELKEIKFINLSTGYAAGNSGVMIKTTNSGINWFTLNLPVSSDIRTFDVFNELIVAGTDGARLVRSTDAGLTWSIIKLNIWSLPAVNCVVINSAAQFTLALESGSVWYSTNSGVTFGYSKSPFMEEITSFSFFNVRGYAVSKNQPVILRSQTTGADWSLPVNSNYTVSFETLLPANGPSGNKIFDINYQKRGILYVLQNNVLMRSAKLGVNWSQLSVLPPGGRSQQLLVSMKDSSKMIAVMNTNIENAVVYRTSNYGINWQEVIKLNIDLVGNLLAQDPQHPDTLYIGAKDTVFRSTDFGLNWVKIAEYPFLDWCDIAVNPANSNVLYGATNHYPAKLHRSTNGGFNWTMIDFIFDTSYSEMPTISVSGLEPNMVLHAQYSSIIGQNGLKRSYTQGNTWLFNQFPGISWSVDIAKDDPALYAYGSVSYDPVFITTNSGGNFTGIPSIWAEQILFYDRANLFINDHGKISRIKYIYVNPIGIHNISTEVPKEFSLSQNYPNPFNPETKIRFELTTPVNVKLIIYDVLGREVFSPVDEFLKAGVYETTWNASEFTSGVYFYKMAAGEYAETKKMILVK